MHYIHTKATDQLVTEPNEQDDTKCGNKWILQLTLEGPDADFYEKKSKLPLQR